MMGKFGEYNTNNGADLLGICIPPNIKLPTPNEYLGQSDRWSGADRETALQKGDAYEFDSQENRTEIHLCRLSQLGG